MSYRLDISLEGEELLQDVFELLSPQNRKRLNQIGMRASVEFVREYHREFDASAGWENLGSPTHGPGRNSSGFGTNVTLGWIGGEADAEGAELINNFPLLAHKVTGGEIRAKRSKALTIPVVPEAHGVRVGDYPEQIFKPKGEEYLAEKVGESEIRAVYLLRKSVTQQPVDGALPDDEEFLSSFVDAVLEHVEDLV